MDNDKKTFDNKLKAYADETGRWETITMTQFGFLNNLLTTLALGLLAFLKDIDMDDPFNGELMFWACFCAFISILIGLYTALSRLVDFNYTRHMNLTRYRVYKYSNGYKELRNKPNDEFGMVIQSLLPILAWNSKRFIHEKDFQVDNIDYADIERRFNVLRKWVHGLGENSRRFLLAQVIIFALMVILFVEARFRIGSTIISAIFYWANN